ncbi:MAG: hypothetical protein V4509_00425 [Patescibacteria group bacterium]
MSYLANPSGNVAAIIGDPVLGGIPNSILLITPAGDLGQTTPSVANTFLQWNGSAFIWSAGGGGSQADWTAVSGPSQISNLFVQQVASANNLGTLTATTPEVNWIHVSSGANDIVSLVNFNTLLYDTITISPETGISVTIQGSIAVGHIQLLNNAGSVTLNGSLGEAITVRYNADLDQYVQVAGKQAGLNNEGLPTVLSFNNQTNEQSIKSNDGKSTLDIKNGLVNMQVTDGLNITNFFHADLNGISVAYNDDTNNGIFSLDTTKGLIQHNLLLDLVAPTLIGGDVFDNFNSVKFAIDNNSATWSVIGNFLGSVNSWNFIDFANGTYDTGDNAAIGNNLYTHLDNLGDFYEIGGEKFVNQTGPTFTGSGLDDFSVVDWNGNANVSYNVQIDGNDIQILTLTPLAGTISFGDTITQSGGTGAGTNGMVVQVGLYGADTYTIVNINAFGPGFQVGEVVDNGSGGTATVSAFTAPVDSFSWTDTLGNSAQFVPMSGTTQLIGGITDPLLIQFNTQNGHTIPDQWDTSFTVNFGLQLSLDGRGLSQAMGDISDTGHSTRLRVSDGTRTIRSHGTYNGNPANLTYADFLSGSFFTGDWELNKNGVFTRVNDSKQIYDVNGIEGILFSGVDSSGVFGTTQMIEQLTGAGFLFPGAFTGPAGTTYTITIDSVGANDTFAWFDNQGNSGSGIPIDLSFQTLSFNATVQFDQITGANLNDTWTFSYDAGAGRMQAMYGGTGGTFGSAMMAIGDTDGAVSGTQTIWLPGIGLIATFGNIYHIQQSTNNPGYTLLGLSGNTTFGTMQILAENPGDEASTGYGDINTSSIDVWRIGANLFDSNDGTFGIGTSNLGNVLNIDPTSGYITASIIPEFLNNAAALLGGMTLGQLYQTTVGGDAFIKRVI